MFSEGKKIRTNLWFPTRFLLLLALIPVNEVDQVQKSRSVIACGMRNQPDLELRLPGNNRTQSNYGVLCQFRKITV